MMTIILTLCDHDDHDDDENDDVDGIGSDDEEDLG